MYLDALCICFYKDVKIYDNAQQIVEEKILFGCRLDKATV